MLKTIKRIIVWCGPNKRRFYWGFLWSFLASCFAMAPLAAAGYALQIMMNAQQGQGQIPPVYDLYALLFILLMILGRFVFSYLLATFQES
ncbi:MAG: ABC transporter ATP-binding protein, partial [Oscillospiraceae bacterium]